MLQEGCTASNDTINNLLTATAAAQRDNRTYTYECHSNGTPSDLAAFLIGAGPYHYWGFGPWVTPHGNYSSAWLPEFDRPLGTPLADAVYNPHTMTWTRAFAGGAHVSFDASSNKGSVVWP